MSYRDELEALAAKNAALEEQLKEAKEERDEALQKLKRSKIKPLKRKDLNRGTSAANKGAIIGAIIGAIAVLGVGAGVYFSLFHLGRSASPTWKATIINKAPIGRLSPGDPCELIADFSSNGTDKLVADHMKLTCKNEVLLDEKPQGQWSLWEGPASQPGSFKYRLESLHDEQSSARPLLNIDTPKASASLLREDGTIILLSIEKYSATLSGSPIYTGNSPQNAGFPMFSWRGSVTSDSGGLSVGASCIVSIFPHSSSSQNCKIEVNCKGTNLYGGGDMGYTSCRVEEKTPIYASDPLVDGDPILLLDLKEGTVKISGERNTVIVGEPTQ